MQLSDGVMVRTRSTQRQERDVTPQESFDLELMVGITRVNTSFQVRFQAKVDWQQPENRLQEVCSSQVSWSASMVPQLAV